MSSLRTRASASSAAAGVVVLLLCARTASSAIDRTADDERTAAGIVAQLDALFASRGDEIWPGFALHERPFLIYRPEIYSPERWALLLHAGDPPAGFGPAPEAVLELAPGALYRGGPLEDLQGQLAVDHLLGDLHVTALPLDMDLGTATGRRECAGFVAHECFHLFQQQAFSELPWEREERYPIDDPRHLAELSLEVAILGDGLRALAAGDEARLRSLATSFAALRLERWSRADPFVRRFEQYCELVEGSARYVELRLALVASSSAPSAPPAALVAAPGLFPPRSEVLESAATELDRLLERGAVRPDEAPRKRVYPVGAAAGALLDALGAEWKPQAMRDARGFAFAEALAGALGVGEAELARASERLREDCALEPFETAAREVVQEYRREFEEALARFEAAPGWRVEIEHSTRNLSRSRSNRERRFVVDGGRVSFAPELAMYVLRASDGRLSLALRQDGWTGPPSARPGPWRVYAAQARETPSAAPPQEAGP